MGLEEDLDVTITATPEQVDGELRIALNVQATRITHQVELSLDRENVTANVDAFLTTEDLTEDLTTTLSWQFTAGVDLSQVNSPADAFFVRQPAATPFRVTGNINQTDATFQARHGLLGLNVGRVGDDHSSISLNSTITVSLGNPNNDASGRITLTELRSTNYLTSSTTQTGTASVDLNLHADPIDVTGVVTDLVGAGSLHFIDTDLFDDYPEVENVVYADPTAPTLTHDFDTQHITDFAKLDAAGVLQMFNNFSSVLGNMGASPVFQQPVPLTSGTTVSDVVSYQNVFDDRTVKLLRGPATDANPAPGPNFETIQQMAALLGSSISHLSYTPTTKLLSFQIQNSKVLPDVSKTISLPTAGALHDLVSTSTLTLQPTAQFDVTVGLQLSPAGSKVGPLTASTPLHVLNRGAGIRTAYGATDLKITLSDGTTFEVNLDPASNELAGGNTDLFVMGTEQATPGTASTSGSLTIKVGTDPTDWAAITNGVFALIVDGEAVTATSLNFTGVTTMAAVATVIQQRINAASTTAADVTVQYDVAKTQMRITSGSTGISSAVKDVHHTMMLGDVIDRIQTAGNTATGDAATVVESARKFLAKINDSQTGLIRMALSLL